jgi:hypothetical protein
MKSSCDRIPPSISTTRKDTDKRRRNICTQPRADSRKDTTYDKADTFHFTDMKSYHLELVSICFRQLSAVYASFHGYEKGVEEGDEETRATERMIKDFCKNASIFPFFYVRATRRCHFSLSIEPLVPHKEKTMIITKQIEFEGKGRPIRHTVQSNFSAMKINNEKRKKRDGGPRSGKPCAEPPSEAMRRSK